MLQSTLHPMLHRLNWPAKYAAHPDHHRLKVWRVVDMEKHFDSISRVDAENYMPQAINCMDYFSKRFFNSFSDELNKNIWVAGGAVRDYFSDGKVSKDVDFFCKDRKTMALLVRELRSKFQYKAYLITKNAIKGYGFVFGKKIDIDIVKKEFASPLMCIDAFDFTVCCMAVTNESFYYHKSAIFDLIRRRLVVHKLPHPVDTLKRLNKYTIKGFAACNGTLLTIAKAIAGQDQNNENLFEFYKFD